MIPAIYNSLSAIKAAVDLKNVSAHNVANTNTDGFKSTAASVIESDNGGVKVSLSRNSQAGTIYQRVDGTEVESSNVDIVDKTAGKINAMHLLAALKTSSDMIGSIIDILA